jgi:hypothetical protein
MHVPYGKEKKKVYHKRSRELNFGEIEISLKENSEPEMHAKWQILFIAIAFYSHSAPFLQLFHEFLDGNLLYQHNAEWETLLYKLMDDYNGKESKKEQLK